MNKTRKVICYILFDILAAILAWGGLYVFRKLVFESVCGEQLNQMWSDPNFWWGITLVPLGWIVLYTIQGTYKDVYRKARLKEFQQTASITFIGCIVLFFIFLLDDQVETYRKYYLSFLVLLLLQFLLTYLFRLVQTSRTVRQIHQRRIGFPTLLLGNKARAYKTYRDLEDQELTAGNQFVGFVSLGGSNDEHLSKSLPCLGELDSINPLIEKYKIEEIVVAAETEENGSLRTIIQMLDRRDDVIIKISPELRDIIYGSVKVSSMFHSPLITLNKRLMEEWQYSLKRILDVALSLIAMVVLSPLYLITAILVKCSSPGPIFYAQERIGLHGKPFKMHKFRTMYVDAEKAGPALSSDNDPRITPVGRFMRKVRLDEIPQFYNVLRGTMSLVGPRPERQYFIDQIVERAPEYLLLQKVKPGITSWGQVKYGYAENVDQMVERLRYDLLYLENMSLTTDIKILLYTVLIIVQGRGK